MLKATSRATREATTPKKPTLKRVEYICTWCGRRAMNPVTHGRPAPGTCPKRSTESREYPHVWRINRKFYD